MTELLNKFNYYYNRFYNSNDYYNKKYTLKRGYSYNISDLSYIFDAIIKDDEIIKIVRQFNQVRGDIITSDREAAALLIAMVKCKKINIVKGVIKTC